MPPPSRPGRTRRDLCPGALRPWPAEDGLLVRLRLVGGRLPTTALARLLEVSQEYADGLVRLTKRANLQLRGLPGSEGRLAGPALEALVSTGLLPSLTHELVRNILVSPQTGLDGEAGRGRADLRPVATSLEAALLGDQSLAALPGRFLFVLDDGRGDLMDRLTGRSGAGTDLGLVALDASEAQLRVGDRWGCVVPLADAARELAVRASAFLAARGSGPTAPWHVRELATPLLPPSPPDPRLPDPAGPLPYGPVPGGTHVAVPDGVLTPALARSLIAAADGSGRPTDLVVTPWHGVLVPEESR